MPSTRTVALGCSNKPVSEYVRSVIATSMLTIFNTEVGLASFVFMESSSSLSGSRIEVVRMADLWVCLRTHCIVACIKLHSAMLTEEFSKLIP